ncbi:colorectal cancer associated 2 [Denticeps clupeoides]|uniref:colorectal cancer associated 2 n=1 Tax=Denticeps clupeoides TaxID=299321 RepID=UPI0010A4FF3E|nr:colorectal cancer-associated protein 2 [Denticeps clupeoides]
MSECLPDRGNGTRPTTPLNLPAVFTGAAVEWRCFELKPLVDFFFFKRGTSKANICLYKPKVYQGVRVKTTVKELLQKRRALQDAIRSAAKSQNLPTPDVSLTTPLPAHHFPAAAPTHDCGFQPRTLPDCAYYDDHHHHHHQHQQQQQLFAMMPAEQQRWAPEYQDAAPDYYSGGGCHVAPGSPTDSLNLPSPADCSSYSPPQSYSSSSSSSCYSSPSRMDSGCGLLPDTHHGQFCTFQDSPCLLPWSGIQEPPPSFEVPPYSNTDCWFSSSLESSFFRRDPGGSEICYL